MFDETGKRSDAGGSAVYALFAGVYWCMLAESNGEAALFDAPEGARFQIGELVACVRAVCMRIQTPLPACARFVPEVILKFGRYSSTGRRMPNPVSSKLDYVPS